MSTCLELFYALRLENDIHCTCLFTFFIDETLTITPSLWGQNEPMSKPNGRVLHTALEQEPHHQM